ncbi:ComEC/Rec2 family competence protein [Alkaliphilus metalliredigens]|uniref:ComEC/Rec2 family competence protein n=1 Tax=Alkaliphilus metalliredigens TaxID=208226 RepID=UPI000674BA3B|nr:ComEC/Rec2 family competence protein [Alkaliphilus metalliredigens]
MEKQCKRIAILTLVLLFLYMLITWVIPKPNDLLTIHVIDVGQGDSILITTPSQQSILIDGGDPTQGQRVVSYLKRKKVKKIDVLIATHPHADHIGGLSAVMDSFEINKLYLPPVTHTSQTYENFLLKAQQHQLPIQPVKDAFSITLEDSITLHFIGPLKDYGDNLNLWSIVMKLDYGKMSFLFTGDIEKEAESDLIREYKKSFLASQFLKAPHHGSNTSSTSGFLDIVNPDIVAISAGRNNLYGHPHTEVLQRLQERAISYYRTDQQGTIVIQSDGQQIWSHQEPYFSNK